MLEDLLRQLIEAIDRNTRVVTAAALVSGYVPDDPDITKLASNDRMSKAIITAQAMFDGQAVGKREKDTL